jgi:glycosyltransferase involved in cell wall biosynthesis
MEPEISVIVCTYNRAAALAGALRSVVQQETGGEFHFEVVVLDDRSTDDTRAVVERLGAQSPVPVRYVRTEGYPASRNRGVEEARGAWVAYFDDDQLAESDWLRELYRAALQTGAAIVGGARRLRFVSPPAQPCGLVTRSILGEKEHGAELCRCNRVSLAVSGNVLIRRDVFSAFGGFATNMPCGMTDIDFTRRALERGVASWYAPTAVVHHLIPPHRLTEEYLRWTCYRVGLSMALINQTYAGRLNMILRCALRVGHAVLVNAPLLVFARLRRDQTTVLDRRCYAWLAYGGARMVLSRLLPRIFPQEEFFRELEFRKERQRFAPPADEGKPDGTT